VPEHRPATCLAATGGKGNVDEAGTSFPSAGAGGCFSEFDGDDSPSVLLHLTGKDQTPTPPYGHTRPVPSLGCSRRGPTGWRQGR
jgi:hypothetical protein